METPPTPVVLDCDPGHDDAISLLLPLASPEVTLLGVTTTYGNQTLAKTTANALRALELVGRTDVPVVSGAERPLEREFVVAAHGRDRADRLHGGAIAEGNFTPAAEFNVWCDPEPAAIVLASPATTATRTGGTAHRSTTRSRWRR